MSLFETKPKKSRSDALILKHARREAREIVASANKKAAAIIEEAQLFTLEARQYANDQLMQAAKNQSELLAKAFKEEFKNHELALEDALSHEYDDVKSEIQKYKEAKLTAIDEEVKKIIKEAVESYLKNNLPFELNEDLVIKTLEYAKQKHIF